jgi:hypothetical protein
MNNVTVVLRHWFTLVIALMLALSARSSEAQGIGIPVKVDATVGLDGPTRELISKFPKEVHDQIIAALTEALPMLDKSVNAYLDKVNEILDHQINHAQCAMTGVVAEVTQRITIFSKDRKGPLLSFDDFKKTQLAKLYESTIPTLYSRVYGDVAHEAIVTYCEMEILGQSQDAVQDSNHYRELNNLWFRIKDSCSRPRDCVTKQFAVTKEAVKQNDPRDVQVADAANRLTKVQKPSSSWFSSFSPEPYNNALAQLVGIQDAIYVAKFKREHDALLLFTKSKDQLAEIDARISTAQRILTPGPFLLEGVFSLNIQFPNCKFISAGQIAAAHRETDAIRTAFSLTDDWLSQTLRADQNLRNDIEKYQEDLRSRREATASLEATKEGKVGTGCPCRQCGS